MRFALTVACALLLAAASAGGQATDLEKLDIVLKMIPDGPVAIVFGEPIPRAEFARLYQIEVMRTTQIRGGQRIPDGARVQIAWRTLADLIQQELLYHQGRKKEIVISKETVEARWQEQLGQYRQGNPKLTEQEVLDTFRAKDRQTVLDQVERMLLIDEMRTRVLAEGNIVVTDDEIAALYEQDKELLVRRESLHLRQLFIRAAADDAPTYALGRKRAEVALARMESGQRFEGIVAELSDAPGKDAGGDMGPGPLDKFPAWLAEPAMRMKPEEISGIIESKYGFHIIKLIALQEGAALSLEEARPVLIQTIRTRKEEQVLLEYSDKLVTEGPDEIHIFLEMEENLAINPDYRNLLLR